MSAETWAGALVNAEQGLRHASDLIESRKTRAGVQELLRVQQSINEAIQLVLEARAR